MDEGLTVKEAYLVMRRFLVTYHARGPNDVMGCLLSDLSLADDGLPMDQGIWHDWLSAVGCVRQNESTSPLSPPP